jgi:3-oxoadipate CoA-transferase, alpha subunit
MNVMIDKQVASWSEAVEGIKDGSTVLVGGFGEVGVPYRLLDALVQQGATDLTIVANNAGIENEGVAALLRAGRVRRVISSYPRSRRSIWFERRYAAGEVELELVPQGTLIERIRAAGAGVSAFFTPTAAGTKLAEGQEIRIFDGRPQVLERALPGDVALVKAQTADRWGNLVYRKTARNYNPTMATAGRLCIAEVENLVPLGALDPEAVVTPGIFVDRLAVAGLLG